jgi:hypothetical protein
MQEKYLVPRGPQITVLQMFLKSGNFFFSLERPFMFLFQVRHKMQFKKIISHISAHIHLFDELMAGA